MTDSKTQGDKNVSTVFYWQMILLHQFHFNKDFSASGVVNLNQAWQFSKKDKLEEEGYGQEDAVVCYRTQRLYYTIASRVATVELGSDDHLGKCGVCVEAARSPVVLKTGLVFIRPAGHHWGIGALALLLAQGPDAIQSHPGFYSLLLFFHRSWKQAEEYL